MTHFVVVPQWQGSPSSRAMQFIDGAAAIAAELPPSARTEVEIPLEAGESIGSGVLRWSSIGRIARRHVDAIAAAGDRVVSIGGDAGVGVTAALASALTDPSIVVVWLSAHSSVGSIGERGPRAYASIAVQALVDPAVPAAVTRVDPSRVLVAGARAADPGDEAAATALGIEHRLTLDADALTDWVRDRHASGVFIHLALDVLDPAALGGIADPVPFGASPAEVATAIRAVRAAAPLVGAALTGFSPASPAAADDDLGTLLRLIGALA